jgi:protein SCO1
MSIHCCHHTAMPSDPPLPDQREAGEHLRQQIARRVRVARTSLAAFLYLASLVLISVLAACDRPDASDRPGDYAAASRADCLPDLTLTDQFGHDVSLASLKGRPVLVDFIYTSCPGPCPMLTAKLASVAKLLGARMGAQVAMVSITLDPEHDHPAELRQYAAQRGANAAGWLFLTGSPAQIERVLAVFDLRREREADGSITHNVATFLLGPDGRQLRQYNGLTVEAQSVAADVETALAHG